MATKDALEAELAQARARIGELEAAADEDRKRVASLEATGKLGFWEWNITQNKTHWSDEVYRIFGVTAERFDPNAYEQFIALIHPEDTPHVTEAMQRAIEDGQPFSVEYRVRRPDGALAHVCASGQVSEKSDCQVMSGMSQDVSQHKQAEEERRSLRDKFLHAQKLNTLGVLAGGIAHDFNNLLVGIVGGANLALLDLPPSSPVCEHIQLVSDAADMATELINQMLAFSGKGSIFMEGVELHSMIENMARLLQSSISKNVILRLDLPDNLPRIAADPSQLNQLIMNLVTNAAEAVGQENEGTVTVSGYASGCQERCHGCLLPCINHNGRSRVTLEVSDTGIGMDAETQGRIFEPYFSTKSTGRGLGLAAVHGILRGHDAGIEVESQRGEGTRIRLHFKSTDNCESADHEHTTKSVTDWRGSGTVLLVDDEPIVRAVGKRVLERLGFTVVTANDGMDGIEAFKRHREKIVCVILDLLMPRMAGKETYSALRKIGANIPILLSSGYTADIVSKDFPDLGATDFIQKPYVISALSAALRAALGTSVPSSARLMTVP